jgi:hypothetical protein
VAVDLSKVPIRMCAVVQLENGLHEAFCIACGWVARPAKTKAAAERIARRHTCRKRGKEVA